MKKIFILCTALLLCAVVQVIAQKSSLKILYVGGSPDLDTFVSRVDSLVLQQSIKERTASFEGMLKAYFETVKVVDAKDYEPVSYGNGLLKRLRRMQVGELSVRLPQVICRRILTVQQ